MRPLLVVIVLLLLVGASLVGGVVGADWPFWQRAWRWHVAGEAASADLPGAHAWLSAADGPRELPFEDDAAITATVSQLLEDEVTGSLLVARDDRLLFEYHGADSNPGARLDGRELTRLPLVVLYGAAMQAGGAPALDTRLGEPFAEWRGDARRDITPRELLQGLSGLERAEGSPLDPFGSWARLASGPNFERAAFTFEAAWPAGSHYDPNPADAQLAAIALVRTVGQPLTTQLRDRIVTPLGFESVRVLLDRHRGAMATHCCIQARARDWLRLGLLLAQRGTLEGRTIYTEAFAAEIERTHPVAPDRALGLERVLLADGTVALVIEGRRRLLVAHPASRSAWLWIGAGDFQSHHRRALLEAARTAR